MAGTKVSGKENASTRIHFFVGVGSNNRIFKVVAHFLFSLFLCSS